MSDEAPLSLGLLEDKDDKCCDLSCQTRLICAAICAGFGVLLTILAIVLFAKGDTPTACILYAVSVIAALGASFFIVGPKKHIARLKDEIAHLIALIVVGVCLVLVFVVCLAIEGTGGVVLGVIVIIVQLCALAIFYLSMNTVTWSATKAILKKLCPCVQ
jgi:inner membrane protein involved in colicin E2 resistance